MARSAIPAHVGWQCGRDGRSSMMTSLRNPLQTKISARPIGRKFAVWCVSLAAALIAAFFGGAAFAQSELKATPASQPAKFDPQAIYSPQVDNIRQETQSLSQYATRTIGTAGHDSFIIQLEEKIRKIPNVKIWKHPFSVVAPVTKKSQLTVENLPDKNGSHAVYPIWPANVRLNTTPKDGIKGRLIYVGQGTMDELPPPEGPNSLLGQIAVMETTGGANWRYAADAGANAIILLGNPQETQTQLHSNIVSVPVNMPRFYIPAGPLADALRTAKPEASAKPAGHLLSDVAWQNVNADNFYVLVKPRAGSEAEQQAIAVVVPIDGMSVVPDLAPSAGGTVNVATALEMLRFYAANPPDRPLMFLFCDAYGINERGIREMFLALAADLNVENRERRDDQEDYDTYSTDMALANELKELSQQSDLLPFLKKVSTDRYRSLYRYIRDESARQTVRDDEEIGRLRLRIAQLSGQNNTESAIAEAEAAITKLRASRDEAMVAMSQLTGRRDLPSVSQEGQFQVAGRMWQAAYRRIAGQYEELGNIMQARRMRGQIRSEMLNELGIPSQNTPIGFVLGLDLSDAGVSAGPSLYCDFYKHNETASSQEFTKWLADVYRKVGTSLWSGKLIDSVDSRAIIGFGEAPESFTVGYMANITGSAKSFGVPGVTWATLNAERMRVDTPQDVYGRLDWRRLDGQILATLVLMERMVRPSAMQAVGLTSDEFVMPKAISGRWITISGVVVDQSPGEPVPRLPMNGFLATMANGIAAGGRGSLAKMSPCGGVRRDEFIFTGMDGKFRFDAVPGHIGDIPGKEYEMVNLFLQAYQLDGDGKIRRAVDLRKIGRGVLLGINIKTRQKTPLRAVVFSCEELSGTVFYDARYLLPLPRSTVLDVRRGSEPQRLNLTMSNGLMSCLLEPGLKWEMIVRAGVTRNRMLLLNVMDPDDVKVRPGFVLRDALLGYRMNQPPFQVWRMTAEDFYNLNELRLDEYRKAGITSAAIEKLRDRTKDLLDKDDQPAATSQPTTAPVSAREYWLASSGALSNELRAYQAVCDMANDVIRGAIFLLLMLLPLSYVLERLLVATPHIYRQIGICFGIFAIMAAGLWSFHPAFRISSQPLMIVMAFAIIFMSLLVISMIFSKFQSGLAEMRSGRAEASGATTSKWGLVSTAVRLGIANMRRRKLRTVLTATTIVLVTFALLCFMSTSNYEGQKESVIDVQSPFTGSLVRDPSGLALPEITKEYIVNVANSSADVSATSQRPVARRYWWCNQTNAQWRVHLLNPADGKQTVIMAGLGLDKNEAVLTPSLAKICPNWDRFAELADKYARTLQAGQSMSAGTDVGEVVGGCYISTRTAKELGVSAGGKIIIAGHVLELVGTFDSTEFDRQIWDMDGKPLTPADYSALTDVQRQQLIEKDLNQIASELESGSAGGPDKDLRRLSSAAVVILPAEMLAGTFDNKRDCGLRSIAVGATNASDAQAFSNELAKRLGYPIYYGATAQSGAADDSVRTVATTPLLPKAPKSIFIPLIIAAGIIFNTMLSSIADRKKEIHVYTSLGLAPLHVGVLFLAEAITYGLMGSVFGYVAGQGVATSISSLGWMGG
ncbi:MAG: ABC transporter permease, partial [Planctomycetaceae bacterium]